MHPDRSFYWTDREAMLTFIAATSFAHIFVQTPGGPCVAHAPLLVTAEGNLRFHLARANPLTKHLDGTTALASIAGPDFYVSPDWYAAEDQVPTWNYLAVEAQGTARRLDNAALVALLDELSAVHEARLAPKTPWTRHKMPAGRFAAMLGAITGFELEVAELRGTRKLSQNKGAADIAGVIAGLTATGRAGEAALLAQPAEAQA